MNLLSITCVLFNVDYTSDLFSYRHHRMAFDTYASAQIHRACVRPYLPSHIPAHAYVHHRQQTYDRRIAGKSSNGETSFNDDFFLRFVQFFHFFQQITVENGPFFKLRPMDVPPFTLALRDACASCSCADAPIISCGDEQYIGSMLFSSCVFCNRASVYPMETSAICVRLARGLHHHRVGDRSGS